jgi:serine/threonine protein kinase
MCTVLGGKLLARSIGRGSAFHQGAVRLDAARRAAAIHARYCGFGHRNALFINTAASQHYQNACVGKNRNRTPFDDEEYFFIIDRLYDTLDKRLCKWKKQDDNYKQSPLRFITDNKGKKQARLYADRILAALDLSDALMYLHKHGIVYRDLKTENVGFDIRNDIKLFDFGLAKKLSTTKASDLNDGTYHLTSMTGSPIYMAPEVGLGGGRTYNEKCDGYSFAILLWEMLTLKTPFELYTVKKLTSRVCRVKKNVPIFLLSSMSVIRIVMTFLHSAITQAVMVSQSTGTLDNASSQYDSIPGVRACRRRLPGE